MGLTTDGEDIDVIDFDKAGNLIISTIDRKEAGNQSLFLPVIEP